MSTSETARDFVEHEAGRKVATKVRFQQALRNDPTLKYAWSAIKLGLA